MVVSGVVGRACRGPSPGERGQSALLDMKSRIQLRNRRVGGTPYGSAAGQPGCPGKNVPLDPSGEDFRLGASCGTPRMKVDLAHSRQLCRGFARRHSQRSCRRPSELRRRESLQSRSGHNKYDAAHEHALVHRAVVGMSEPETPRRWPSRRPRSDLATRPPASCRRRLKLAPCRPGSHASPGVNSRALLTRRSGAVERLMERTNGRRSR